MNVSTQSLQTALVERSRQVRPATAEDAVAGVTPSVVVEPETDEEVAAVLRFADAEGLAVLVRGGGTRLAMGSPPSRGDILLSTARLSSVVEHAPHDLTVSVQAGLPLGDLQAAAGKARQWLALDPAVPLSATIGGLIATNASGAHRLRYGGVRDQLIGLRVVLPDGTIAKGGGKVVKNVAGYDLPKLYTGALGTLGVIVGATFRLYPQLPHARTVVLPASTPEPLGEMAVRAINSTLVPAVVDIFGPGLGRGGTGELGRAEGSEPQRAERPIQQAGRPTVAPNGAACALVVRFESGVEASVTEQADALLGMAGALTADAYTLEGEDERALWRNADAALSTGDARDGSLLVKASLLPAEVGPWLAALGEHTGAAGVKVRWRAHAGHGLVFARLDGDSGSDQETVARAVRTLRQEAEARRGTVVVLDGPTELLRQIDVWGPIPALDVMRRVKARFDPNGILNPGRFVGGL